MAINKAGVVGCGTMGAGIALACARAGYDTTVLEISRELLDKGLKDVAARLDGEISAGRMTPEQKRETLERLRGTVDYGDLADRDLVIEVAPERLELKRTILRQIEAVVGPGCILASNTSSLPIIEMAGALERPERMVGLHFCHPAHIMELVELIRKLPGQDRHPRQGLPRLYHQLLAVPLPPQCHPHGGTGHGHTRGHRRGGPPGAGAPHGPPGIPGHHGARRDL